MAMHWGQGAPAPRGGMGGVGGGCCPVPGWLLALSASGPGHHRWLGDLAGSEGHTGPAVRAWGLAVGLGDPPLLVGISGPAVLKNTRQLLTEWNIH